MKSRVGRGWPGADYYRPINEQPVRGRSRSQSQAKVGVVGTGNRRSKQSVVTAVVAEVTCSRRSIQAAITGRSSSSHRQ